MVWYSHLLKNFPQFIVIHAVKGFGIVNKAEIDVFLELSCFFYDPADVGNLLTEIDAAKKKSQELNEGENSTCTKEGKWLQETMAGTFLAV